MSKAAPLGGATEVLDHLPEPAMVISSDFKLLYLNQAARESLRVDGNAIGGLCYEIIHHRDQPCHLYGEPCQVLETVEKKIGVKVLRRYLDEKDGDNFHELTAAPIFDQTGHVQSVLTVVMDLRSSGLLAKIESSEKRLKNMMTSSPNGNVIIDSRGIVLDCNPAVEKLFGWRPNELIGRSVTVLMPHRIRDQHEKELATAVQRGEYKYEGQTVELTGWHKKRKKEFPITISLSSWQEGEETRFAATIMDRSQRQSLEISLQGEKTQLEKAQTRLNHRHLELKKLFHQVEKAKEEWERTMDCIGSMVLLVSSRDRILRCNKAMVEFCGIPYEQILGKNWEDLLLGNDMETNYSRGKAIELFHPPTRRWFLLNIYKYGDGNSATARFVITVDETTKLKRIAERLSEKNEEIEENRSKLKKAFEEISALIDKATAKQSGVRFEYPGGGMCWKISECQRSSCPCHGQSTPTCWRETGSFFREVLLRTDEDTVESKACPFYEIVISDPIYQIGEQFNNMMDILETKNRELEEAYKELKATQAQILQQEKMASIGQLAAGVAHELNNPLGFIASNLGTLQKYLNRLIEFLEAQSKAVRTDQAEDLAQAKSRLKVDYILGDTASLISESLEGADRLKKIIQDLKSFSRVDQAELNHADITECLESTINIVWNELKYKATVIKEYGELPLTKCYPQQLNQVFMNLLVNAVQAIEKQGEIRIKTWCDNDFIYVDISDTGCGIPEENRKHLFEPFFTTKEVGKGTGLGLSITYDIIKKHHGTITVESDVGKGTTFTVKIPVVEDR